NVPGFGERGGVRDRERNVEDSGEGLSEERFADAGGPDQQDVRLVELDVVLTERGRVDALVVIVDRDGERLLRLLLTDYVLVESVLDLLRSRDLGNSLRYLALFVLRQDFVAERDAL